MWSLGEEGVRRSKRKRGRRSKLAKVSGEEHIKMHAQIKEEAEELKIMIGIGVMVKEAQVAR